MKMPLSADISSALQLLEHIQLTINQSDDVKLQAQTADDLNFLISSLENPILRSIVTIQDSLSELNGQLQQHPSILPVDFDIGLGGDLILSVPPPLYEADYVPASSPRTEFDDQRVPVAKLSQSSSGDSPSPQIVSPAPDDASLLPITTPSYALEFQKAIEQSSHGREVQTIKKLLEKADMQSRNLTALEERCGSLKATIDQLNLTLERASATETELWLEIQSLQRTLQDTSQTSHTSTEKLKQLQKSLTNSENERRVMAERLEAAQQALQDLRRAHQHLTDTHARTNQELTKCEVQRAGLESQLRLANWPSEAGGEDSELHRLQKERSELRIKLEGMHDKVRHLENEKRSLERKVQSRSKSFERADKSSHDTLCSGRDTNQLDLENRELKHKVRRLEALLEEKEAELARLKSSMEREHHSSRSTLDRGGELEKYRAGQLQAERLLEAREQSHRQQVQRLESQIQLLRDQLNQEVKRRQMYVLRSSRMGREAQQLRQVLGDSLSRVSQDPSLDAGLLEHEARKLDTSVTPLALPPPRPHTPHTPH